MSDSGTQLEQALRRMEAGLPLPAEPAAFHLTSVYSPTFHQWRRSYTRYLRRVERPCRSCGRSFLPARFTNVRCTECISGVRTNERRPA